MRTFEDVQHRWALLFDTSIGVDLRQAIRDDSGFDPCEEGLRSVCWRAFLLYGPLSTRTWRKKLIESRSAYSSLRDHFLKFINNPDDLHSSTDPLADDETSPWSTFRQDEISREEIFQDVTRCMQDNYFFREPVTQRRLLDILFIYSKLNPDTGYRQGMHELLAPILWVIDQDVIDLATVTEEAKSKEGAEFMLEVLDRKHAENDAFALFCAVMQTAKSFYEMGENKDSSAIVAQSDRIHNELLAAVDQDLAHHLQVVGVLPQIYSIRWIRLLFGREFEFKDVLKIWDMLFAENFTMDIVDMTCVAALLRVRWQLIVADYTTAITLLTRFKLPPSKESPRSLVKDACFLNKNKTLEGGASVIQHYSGQRPRVPGPDEERPYSPIPSQQRQVTKRLANTRSSQSPSPARFATPQKQLETLISEVSGTLQRRTEGWSVSKAVRGAVGEVKRNVNNFQTGHSREASVDGAGRPNEENQLLRSQLEMHAKRNKALSKMLDGATMSLRTCKIANGKESTDNDDVFNMALAKIQFISVYLADSDIPIPQDEQSHKAVDEQPKEQVSQEKNKAIDDQFNEQVNHPRPTANKPTEAGVLETDMSAPRLAAKKEVLDKVIQPTMSETTEPDTSMPQLVTKKGAPRLVEARTDKKMPAVTTQAPGESSKRHQTRPSLADSSFSFMLGENRHRSSFVSSITDPPEQRRGSDVQDHPKKLWEDSKNNKEGKIPKRVDDGFTMNPLR